MPGFQEGRQRSAASIRKIGLWLSRACATRVAPDEDGAVGGRAPHLPTMPPSGTPALRMRPAGVVQIGDYPRIDPKGRHISSLHRAMRRKPCDGAESAHEKRPKSANFGKSLDRQRRGLIDPDRHGLADLPPQIFPADPTPPRDQHPSSDRARINAPYFIRGDGAARIEGNDHGSET
jgi:hypothetical protein